MNKIELQWKNSKSYKTPTVHGIVNFILDQYQEQTKISNKPKHTDFLFHVFQKICKWSKLSEVLKRKTKTLLDRKVLTIRILSNQRTRPARTYNPYTLLKLIQDQWSRPIFGNGSKAIIRKYSSAMAMICMVTGRRWVDVTRIRWDNWESYTTELGTFYKFYLPASKTNIRGQRIECITLRNVKSDTILGPIYMLDRIRFWQGNPSKGFVFPCVHKSIRFTRDPIWEPWSSYRCNGHWMNKEKAECVGQIDGNVTIGVLQRFAKSRGWKTVPTKHTFRRLVTLLHRRQGLTSEQINEQMGWIPTSNMSVHYAAAQDSLMKSAPANVYANELEKSIPFESFNDLQFEL